MGSCFGMSTGDSSYWSEYKEYKKKYEDLQDMKFGEFEKYLEEEKIKLKENMKPDYSDFSIDHFLFKNGFTAAWINYRQAKQFSGKKILVFLGDVRKQLMKVKEIDPHFKENDKLSPIARFEASQRGEIFLSFLLEK